MNDHEPVPLACTKRDPHTAHTWSSFGEQYACPGHERSRTETGGLMADIPTSGIQGTATLDRLTENGATYIADGATIITLSRDNWTRLNRPVAVQFVIETTT